jgi:SAM-dependent methyltransferase
MKKSDEVKAYYDDFSDRVLLKDFYYVNRRQEKVVELCRKYVRPADTVLEIGCGNGILSKNLRKIAAYTVSVDISDNNINTARLYCGNNSRGEFLVMDVLDNIDDLQRFGHFSVILLSDVIEHIPREHHKSLFASLEGLLAPGGGTMIITFPSYEYQEYIRQHSPAMLQIVDESLHPADLLSLTSLRPVYMTYVDAWGTNQYVHVVLRPAIDYLPLPLDSLKKNIIKKIKSTIFLMKNIIFLLRFRSRSAV